MGRTLRKILFCAALAGSLLLNNCVKSVERKVSKTLTGDEDAYSKALRIAQDPSSIYNGNVIESKELVSEKEKARIEQTRISNPKKMVGRIEKMINKGLENYFFQGEELSEIKLASAYSEGMNSNPGIVGIEELNADERGHFESNKILKMGIGAYHLPLTEHALNLKDLTLLVVEFESKKDREEFIRKLGSEVTYPFFTKDNILSYIEQPTIDEITDPFSSFSEEQGEAYFKLLRNYSIRTLMDVEFSRDEDENLGRKVFPPD